MIGEKRWFGSDYNYGIWQLEGDKKIKIIKDDYFSDTEKSVDEILQRNISLSTNLYSSNVGTRYKSIKENDLNVGLLTIKL